MAIKDPIDALEKHFTTENLSSDPVIARLARWISGLPLPWPASKGLDWILARLNADRMDKHELMLKALTDEVRANGVQLDAIRNESEDHKQQRFAEWFALVRDGHG